MNDNFSLILEEVTPFCHLSLHPPLQQGETPSHWATPIFITAADASYGRVNPMFPTCGGQDAFQGWNAGFCAAISPFPFCVLSPRAVCAHSACPDHGFVNTDKNNFLESYQRHPHYPLWAV